MKVHKNQLTYKEAFELVVRTRVEMAKRGVTGYNFEIGFISEDFYLVIAVSGLYSEPSQGLGPLMLYAREGFWITPDGNIGSKMNVKNLHLNYGGGNWQWD